MDGAGAMKLTKAQLNEAWRQFSSKGGKAGGDAKIRPLSSERAKAMIALRWGNRKAKTVAP